MGTPTTIEDGDRLVDTFRYTETNHCSIWRGLSGSPGSIGGGGGYGPGAGGLVLAVIAVGETASYAAMVYGHFKRPDHEMTVYYDASQRVERREIALLPRDANNDVQTSTADTPPKE